MACLKDLGSACGESVGVAADATATKGVIASSKSESERTSGSMSTVGSLTVGVVVGTTSTGIKLNRHSCEFRSAVDSKPFLHDSHTTISSQSTLSSGSTSWSLSELSDEVSDGEAVGEDWLGPSDGS